MKNSSLEIPMKEESVNPLSKKVKGTRPARVPLTEQNRLSRFARPKKGYHMRIVLDKLGNSVDRIYKHENYGYSLRKTEDGQNVTVDLGAGKVGYVMDKPLSEHIEDQQKVFSEREQARKDIGLKRNPQIGTLPTTDPYSQLDAED